MFIIILQVKGQIFLNNCYFQNVNNFAALFFFLSFGLELHLEVFEHLKKLYSTKCNKTALNTNIQMQSASKFFLFISCV